MTLHAQFTVPERRVAVDLTVPSGSTTAIIGPNGSGKSTVLQVLAGLVEASGSARLGSRVLFDAHTFTPAHRRRIAMLAQQPRLFPRMTALGNVEFALRARGASVREAPQWLHLVAAADIAARRPAQLSGGQAQRVAIARALAADPEVLLLDEPLVALDAPIASEIRHMLAEVLTGRTVVLVTHEILDAALMSDQVVVMVGGDILESGPTSRVMREPRSDFAASMCGLNLLRGVAAGRQQISTDSGMVTGAGSLIIGTQAVACFPPTAVAVYLDPPRGSPRNVFRATVTNVTAHGQVVRVNTDLVSADLTAAAIADLGLRVGTPVFLTVKATEVRLYPH
jgi:molybdate transport system ATP-binding protein